MISWSLGIGGLPRRRSDISAVCSAWMRVLSRALIDVNRREVFLRRVKQHRIEESEAALDHALTFGCLQTQ